MATDAIQTLLQLPPQPDAQPAARRELRVFGAPAELVWLPHRSNRTGIPGRNQQPFQAPIADRIIAEESLWRNDTLGLAATPNRYPFAINSLILWNINETREPSLAMLTALAELSDAGADDGESTRSVGGATAVINTVGAAASVTRSHGHLLRETRPFLEALPERVFDAPWLDRTQGVEVVCKDLPVLLLGLRGPAPQRARAAQRALELRTTAAVSVIDTGGTTWILPRSREEIPAPSFPAAIGASEWWGRWCYMDEEPFNSATSAKLEDALLRSGVAYSSASPRDPG